MTALSPQLHRTDQNSAASAPKAEIRVWDPALRLFHWLLAGTVAGAALTGFSGGATSLDLHIISGTAIALLLTFRVIWGFTGPDYARFRSFVPAPASFLHHARELLRGGASDYLGHNPVGSAMILALLAVLAAIIGTGVAVLGGVVKEGPLAPFLSFTAAGQVKEIHELLAFLLLGLVALHLAGVLGESWRTRENLIRAMVTGYKHAREGAVAAAAVRTRPLTAAFAFVGLTACAGAAIAYFSLMPAFGVPDKPMDTAYAKECGSCHSPHHPSVAPAATWTAIMSGLDSHFGENASLDPALTAQLSTYLADNAAEKWDTWPANRLRAVPEQNPLRITDTRGWKRLHSDLPDDVFKSKAVGGKLNCSKCHRDAEAGRFNPRAIAIPEEKASR
jgi:cytochrome b